MKVGIIGAGTMGSGIAQAFAQTEGYEVYLCDINEEFAANGKNKIAKGLQRLVTKGKKTQEDVDAILFILQDNFLPFFANIARSESEYFMRLPSDSNFDFKI